MRIDDLLISIAYFSIPVQLVVSLYKYPRLASMPIRLVILCVLFALFIFLCGSGHLMRCLGYRNTTAFTVMNSLTCIISVITALYLLPLVPILMSELDSSLEKLRKLNEESEASKRKLFTFMSFLCHEIRNPLFAITSNIEFAQDMNMTAALEESLQSISQSANLMLRLVNDVLDLSKIESGKLELEEHEFDIREFFSNLSSTMDRQIKAKRHGQVDFVFNMGHSLPRFVQSDSVRLLQIAYNILSNACKFTEQGTITFSVSMVTDKSKKTKVMHRPSFKPLPAAHTTAAMEDVSDGSVRTMLLQPSDLQSDSFSMALLEDAEAGLSTALTDQHKRAGNDDDVRVLKMTFEDTGTGIAPEQLERIFQPYAQAKLSDFRKHGGTGLGLSIISKLLDMMGGSVKVSSVINEGAKFVVLLPIVVPKKQRIKKRNSFAKLDDMVDSEAAAESHITPTPLEATPVANAVPLSADCNRHPNTESCSLECFSNQPKQARPDMMSQTPSPSTPTPPGSPSEKAPPMREVATTAVSTPSTKSSKPTLKKFQFPKNTNVVLVVDDNAVNRKLIGKMLSFFHVEYQTAENGQEALQIMKESRNLTGNPSAPYFGLVLMDLCMPVMDGYESIESIRGVGKELKWVPIVALTANAMAEEKRKALEAGATEFDTKPILRHVLHATCVRHLGPTTEV